MFWDRGHEDPDCNIRASGLFFRNPTPRTQPSDLRTYLGEYGARRIGAIGIDRFRWLPSSPRKRKSGKRESLGIGHYRTQV